MAVRNLDDKTIAYIKKYILTWILNDPTTVNQIIAAVIEDLPIQQIVDAVMEQLPHSEITDDVLELEKPQEEEETNEEETNN